MNAVDTIRETIRDTRVVESANTLRAGFGHIADFAQMLDFTVDLGDIDQAQAALRAGGQALRYNLFTPEALAKALGAIRLLHPSGFQVGVAFGREGSPVCYIGIPYYARYGGTAYTVSERRDLANRMMQALREIAKPDELDTVADFAGDPFKIRAWWD